MSHLSLTLLGPPQVTLDGNPITSFESSKVRALLAYLAVEADRPHHRDALATLLWPNYPDRGARTNLRRALYSLRRAIRDREAHPPFLLISRRLIQFNTDSDCWVDVAAFSGLVATDSLREPPTGQLEEAVALYRGPLLEGFSIRDSAVFDDWCLLTQERFHRQALAVLQRLAGRYERQGLLEQACEMARRQVEMEPWQEEAHRELMRLLALRGLRTAALHQYQVCERLLREELGVAPDPETTALYTAIRQRQVRPPPPPSAAIPDQPQRLLPTDQAKQLPATRRETPSERRIVTILYSNVKGATSMAEHLDPEEVMEIMQGALNLLIQPIASYGGTVARLMSDGVLALFGAPIAHEDDAERACRAALDIMEGAHGYAARLEQERGLVDFGVRAVIHTGLVTVGEVGSDPRVEYTAMGDAVNVASGMEGAAEPGMVLITEDTHRLIAPLFQTEALGPAQVRGRSEPVVIYRVLATKDVMGKGRGIAGLASPLVGRDMEFQALQEALERLELGVGAVVTIVGEAGVGKSRLLAELRQGVMPSALQWAEGRCLSYGTSVAYLLWLDVLRALLGVTVEDSPASVQKVLQERVQRLCPDSVDSIYPYLAHLMSLPLNAEQEALLQDVLGERLKANTFRAVETLLECSASDGPLSLVCEDLHWADPTSIELLERLLALSDRAPLLLICVFRPYREHGCWQVRETAGRLYHHRHTDLWLEPLTAAESATMVGNLLHIETLAPRLRERILSHAEGNPFYIEEIIRSLIDSDAIAYDEATGRWQGVEDVQDIAIPDTLQGVLTARMDGLQEEARQVLQLASVIGRIFLYRVLAVIAQAERELDGHLLTLQREEMIRERARVPELEYIFKHELTREAAYNGLLRQQRRRFHLQVGEALQRLFPERVEEQLGLLAYHFTQAEAWEKAFHYLTRAGHQARRAYANQEAIAHYTQALEVSGRITPPLDEAELLPVYEGRGVVFRLLPSLDEAFADFRMMRQMAVASGNQQKEAESLYDLASVRWWRFSGEEIPVVEQYGREALRLAQLAGDQRTVAKSLTSLALVDQYRGDLQEADRKFEESLQISRREGYRDSTCENLLWLGVEAYWQGDYERGIPHCQEGLAVARGIHDRFAELLNLCSLCLYQASLGDYGEALNTIHEGMTKAREWDNKYMLLRLTNTLGWIHGLFGDHSRAAEYDQESAELGRTGGHASPEISALINLGADYLGLGQVERARSHLVETLERIETGESGAHRFVWKQRLLNVLAEACHAMGDHREALRYVEESLGIAVASSMQKYTAKGWALRGRILANLGNAEAAGTELLRAFALAEKLKSPSITYPIAYDLGKWYEATGQGREAAELYGRAKAEVERMAVAMEDEALRSIFLEWAPVQAIYEGFARVG